MAEAATEIAKKTKEVAETTTTVNAEPTKMVENTEEKTEPTVNVEPPKMVEKTDEEAAKMVSKDAKKPAEEEANTTKETSTLVGKLETEVEIKASADKFHHMFAGKPHHASKASPGNIQGCDLHEGDWGKPGSIVYWNYVHDGKKKVAKERIEEVEPEKNLITFRVIEGDLMEEYKSFLLRIQVTPKEQGGSGSIVHWHLEYEKISEDVAHPETLLQFCIDVSKEIDEYLLNEE